MADIPQYKCFLLKDRCVFMYSLAEVPVGCRIYAAFIEPHHASKWCVEHNKFAEVACAWEEGKQIQFKSNTEGWVDCTDNEPHWYKGLEYRVSPDQKINKLAEAKEIIRNIIQDTWYIILQKEKEKEKLKTQIVECREEIIKALKECTDVEWLPAHNGNAKYVYLQSVLDIVNEKFERMKEE